MGLKFQNLAKIGQNHRNSKKDGPSLFVMKCKIVGSEILRGIRAFLNFRAIIQSRDIVKFSDIECHFQCSERTETYQ